MAGLKLANLSLGWLAILAVSNKKKFRMLSKVSASPPTQLSLFSTSVLTWSSVRDYRILAFLDYFENLLCWDASALPAATSIVPRGRICPKHCLGVNVDMLCVWNHTQTVSK